MCSNVAALQLRKEFDRSLLKSCYDALKQNKETEKFNRARYELMESE